MCINACIWQCWSCTWMMTCDSTSFIWIEMYTMTYERFGNCIHVNSWLHANLQECLEITCVWTHLHDDIWQGSEIAWMRPWINAYIWPYFIYACVNMYIHRSMWLFVLQNCIDMNMCIHPDMWPHSESPWMWLCSETPCTYQHLTVLRNFMYVYANNDSTQTLYMWTCTYLPKCDCYRKLHECEHTCTQRYMTLCGNNFMWRCTYILTFDCAKRL